MSNHRERDPERFLVTGALGCIGAWTCALLAEEGVDVVGFDFGTDDSRLRLATDADIPLVQGDIVDGKALARLSTSTRSRT